MAGEVRDSSEVKPRILQVFEYLKALHAYRSPAEQQIGKQRWSMWLKDLPNHPSVQLVEASARREGDAVGELPDVLLTVQRPVLTKVPEPPDLLREWLESGWGDPYRDVSVRTSVNRIDKHGDTFIETFEADQARPAALREWLPIRKTWAKNEVPARDAMHCFERLYQLHGQLEKEGETHELAIGNGLLSWKVASGSIFHPILVQSVQLVFNSKVPEFHVRQTDAPPELYTALFASVPQVDGQVLAASREELRSGGYHPLAEHEAKGFLGAFAARLAVDGEFVAQKPDKDAPHPTIGFAPVLFLRSRAQGFAAAIEKVLDSLASSERWPAALERIVGANEDIELVADAVVSLGSAATPQGSAYDSLLFSKPANDEQYRIAANLEQQSCVLVQGPPGTGKSHTIANLIGHLLAKGDRILVTAHTTKALRVLRQQVVEPLRPLCVSVLDDEMASRRELEIAVSSIVERLSRSDPGRLAKERDDFAKQRTDLVAKVREAEQRVVEARATEYREIVFAGRSFEPSDAARHLVSRTEDSWIPAPVRAGAPLPLSEREVDELYATNYAVSAEDEFELQGVLPELAAMPSPREFESLVTKRAQLERAPRNYRQDLWIASVRTSHQQIESLTETLMRVVALLPDGEPWRRAAALAAFKGAEAANLWTELIGLVEGLLSTALSTQNLRMQHGPELPEEHCSDATTATIAEIISHVDQGGGLGSAKLLFNPSWREFLRVARVDGREARLGEHFRALLAHVELEQQRRALRGRWDRQVAALGGPPSSDLGLEIENAADQYAQVLREAMAAGSTLLNALNDLRLVGLDWPRVLGSETPRHGQTGEIDRIVAAIGGNVIQQLVQRSNAFRWEGIEAETRLIRARVSDFASNHAASAALQRLDRAARELDVVGYREGYENLARVLSTRDALARRRDLLRRLDSTAPAWASAVSKRQGVHCGDRAPGPAADAWLFRQLADEIGRRQRLSLESAQAELERGRNALRQVTAELIDRAAWERQTRRTSTTQRQALMGWLDTVKRIGKGTGKRAGVLRAEAQRLMTQAAEAVPVWVMPLSRVVHSFDPAREPFDVVIIDEASQMDVLGLIAIYLGKKVVVVGDHEQVSPLAVGQDLDGVSKLISEHLAGIPNAHLYDGRQSVYDLARQSFGGTVRLVEHFRCVPQIIEFSNWLSYGGDIKALREASSSTLLPHVVAHRVQSDGVLNKVNRVEAMEIVSLIAAACEDSEFEGKTFGVISLVGDEQANFIDEQLRKRIAPDEHAKRRLICGNPSQFQGDERDVMWLSVVDVPEGGPLRMRSDQTFQQRYNVAASRAKDQI